ncbi:hypothetical protein TWF106_009326 [Orbilia oligospora]|uniref:N-acetyltransferase domain-containing protein n=1 Tax=Orbilia oligospora TaxID=2813651 RepID=A0A7C8QHW1_ORBOL|nr:hypothetical protein TWF106_009326 [Orbilia oligospora]KAF3220240.1 hypothetical protein TWF679_009620 [Orbilia oligospora]
MVQPENPETAVPLTPAAALRFTISPAIRSDLPDVINLFTLYAESLHIDLSFQSFTEELAGLPGKYAQPTGEILVARRAPKSTELNGDREETHSSPQSGDAIKDIPAEALGCVAVRPITIAPPFDAGFDANTKKCEMKRLYTLPSTRGRGVGKELINEVLRVAVELGYDEMYLDTLASMGAALAAYEKVGFTRTKAYYHNPNEDVVFLVKKLRVGE